MEFDPTLMWDSEFLINYLPRQCYLQTVHYTEWALPDQLVSTTVSALLRFALLHPQYRALATSSILEFSFKIINLLRNEHRKPINN